MPVFLVPALWIGGTAVVLGDYQFMEAQGHLSVE
jgi:hypothetical protein